MHLEIPVSSKNSEICCLGTNQFDTAFWKFHYAFNQKYPKSNFLIFIIIKNI